MINFEVFDEKSFTDDELIACVRFPLPESLFKSELCEEWLPLSGKLGEQKEGSLHIRIVFTVIFMNNKFRSVNCFHEDH